MFKSLFRFTLAVGISSGLVFLSLFSLPGIVQAQTQPNSENPTISQVDLQDIQRQLEQNPELWSQAQKLLLTNPVLVQKVMEQLLSKNPQLIQQIQQSPELMKLAMQQGQVLIQFIQQNQELFEQLKESLSTIPKSLPQKP